MLKVNEIFYSIQGEGAATGRPCIFIRLTGCKLRCSYCDTKYAYFEGVEQSIEQILTKIAAYPTKLVLVTGGEPLEQEQCPKLLERLVEVGYEVLLETDGVEDVSRVPAGVHIIMDVKTPGSKMASPKSLKNLQKLPNGSEVKFVLTSHDDYEFAKKMVKEHRLSDKQQVLFSPAFGELTPSWLADQILADGLDVRLQTQLHKQLWGEARGV